MRRLGGCAGSTVVETLLLILVMFVPLVAMLGAIARVHQAAWAVTAAAREAGSAAAAAADPAAAAAEARTAAAMALNDQALPWRGAETAITGLSAFGRGSRLEVRVSYPVRLVRLPLVADRLVPTVWVRASHTAQVDPYRSEP